MVPEPNEPLEEPGLPYADYMEVLGSLSNTELLEALDLGLLELEKRLGQALSSAQHAEGHLQIVGVGAWKPTSTRSGWNTEPRLSQEEA